MKKDCVNVTMFITYDNQSKHDKNLRYKLINSQAKLFYKDFFIK
jgi:hypothetical protein